MKEAIGIDHVTLCVTSPGSEALPEITAYYLLVVLSIDHDIIYPIKYLFRKNDTCFNIILAVAVLIYPDKYIHSLRRGTSFSNSGSDH